MNHPQMIELDEIASAFAPDRPGGQDFEVEFGAGVAERIARRGEGGSVANGAMGETEGAGGDLHMESETEGGRILEWAPRWLRKASAIAPAGAVKLVTGTGAKGAGAKGAGGTFFAGPILALAALVVLGAWLLASALRLSADRDEPGGDDEASIWTRDGSSKRATVALYVLMFILSPSVSGQLMLSATVGVLLVAGTLAIIRALHASGRASAERLSGTLASFLGHVGFSLWIAGGYMHMRVENLLGMVVIVGGAIWLARDLPDHIVEGTPFLNRRRAWAFPVIVLLGAGIICRVPFGRSDAALERWVAAFDEPGEELLDWADLGAVVGVLSGEAAARVDVDRLSTLLEPDLDDLHPTTLGAAYAIGALRGDAMERAGASELEDIRRGNLRASIWPEETVAAIQHLVARGEWTDEMDAALLAEIERDWPDETRRNALEKVVGLLAMADAAGLTERVPDVPARLATLLERRVIRCNRWLEPAAVAGFGSVDSPDPAFPYWSVSRGWVDETEMAVRAMERLHALDPERYAALDLDVAGVARFLDRESRGYFLMGHMTYAPQAAAGLRRLERFDPAAVEDRVGSLMRLGSIAGALLSLVIAAGAVSGARRRASVFTGPPHAA